MNMYQVKKMIIISPDGYIDMSDQFRGIPCNSYEEVHEIMKIQGIPYYIFIMEPIQEEK